MRNVKMTILFVFVILLYAGTSKAQYYNDGQIHNIKVKYGFGIVVGNSDEGKATTVNIFDGGWVANYTVTGDSFINISSGGYVMNSDGSYGGISDSYGNTEIAIQDGIIDGSLRAWDNSKIAISSGTITSWTRAYNDSVIDISGGNIGDNFRGLMVYDKSTVTISGGQINGLLEINTKDSFITVFGSDFILDGQNVSGEIFNSLNQIKYGHLTGFYLDDEPIDIDISMYPEARIVLVPEPGAFLLFGLGGFAMIRKRRLTATGRALKS